MKDIAIAIPVWKREHLIDPLIRNIEETTPNARTIWVCSDNDPTNVYGMLKDRGQEVWVIKSQTVMCDGKQWNFADFSRKINYAFRISEEPLFFTGATDIQFQPGWLDKIKEQVAQGYGVIGPRDGYGPLATHALCTREYGERGSIDNQDCLLYEGYWHDWVMDEFVETAKYRGAYTESDVLVKHMVHERKWDDDYKNAEPRIVQGAYVFQSRLHMIPGAVMHEGGVQHAREHGFIL